MSWNTRHARFEASRAAIVIVSLAFASLQTSRARAADRFWATPAGGVFAATGPTNWATTQGGANGATVPAGADIANFTLNTTYTVSFTTSPTNQQLHVENGTVTFDLLGQTYTHTTTNGTAIGNMAGQTARLTVIDGTMRSDTANDTVEVGSVAGSTGHLTLSTAGRWTGGMDLVVATAGTGNLTIENGADAAPNDSVIGLSAGGVGVATVTGVGSTWSNAMFFTVGNAGAGTLSILDAGQVTSASASIALDPTSTSSVRVADEGSRWSQSAALTVADAGVGTLRIDAGGRVASGSAVLGNAATGEGLVTIIGTGSTWSIADALAVGSTGQGILQISGGGQLASGAATIGTNALSNGTVSVRGVGSNWAATGAIAIGLNGSGTLTIDDGAEMTTSGSVNINDPGGAAVGTLNLAGGSLTAQSLTRTGTLNWTDGTLTVVGGTFNNGPANLTINGAAAGDLPTLRLAAGASGTNFAATTLTIGSSRGGALSITGGSTLSVNEAHVGSLDGGSGTLTVGGLNSQFTTVGTLAVGGTSDAAGGAAVLNVESSGEVLVQGMLQLWAGGTVNVNGGTLKFAALDPQGGSVKFNAGRIQFLSSQTLGQSDGVADALVGPAHALGLGRTIDAAGGPLTIATNLTLDGGHLAGSQLIVLPAGEIQLANPNARIDNSTIRNQGILSGTGRIGGTLLNEPAGQVRVGSQERLVFSGSAANTNNGLIDISGGTIEFAGPTANNSLSPATGAIAGRNSVLRFHGGLTNSGSLVFSNGTMDVFGDINNVAGLPTTGRIVVSGGGTANFYDDILNSGTIQVSAAGSLQSAAVFFGSLTGNGVSGAGHVFIEGDARPGFSPGIMAFGGDVSFGPDSKLTIELGGPQPGIQHDQIAVADSATLAGTLAVTLLDNFVPVPGQQFTVMTYGSHTGTFDTVATLATDFPSLVWTASYSSTAVTLTAGPLAGDINLDAVVDKSDLALFVQHFGTRTGATFSQGDFNSDGRTSLADLRILKNNFGASLPPQMPTQPVPEPLTAIMACAACLLIGWPLRKRLRQRRNHAA